MRVVFFGTSEFAVDVLNALHEDPRFEIPMVVSQPSSRSGRGQKTTSTALVKAAEELELNTFLPMDANDADSVEQLKAQNADLFITAAYGQKLSDEVLGLPVGPSLNLHGSLLPRHRGAAPVQFSILEGDTVTGVSLMRMTDRMDAGPVYATAETPIEVDDTGGSLMERLGKMAGQLILDHAGDVLAGKLEGKEQDEEAATAAPSLAKEQGRVPWNTSAIQIDRHVRGMTPWPSAFTFCPTDRSPARVQVVKGEILDLPSPAMPGTVVAFTTGIEVATTKGVYRILEVKRSGKRSLEAVEFLRGFPLPVGSRLQ